MRVLVFFDLPTETNEDKKAYRAFRRFLMKNGFMMMQESVYCRLLLNQTAEEAVRELIRKNKPTKGIVQMLAVTEKQFSKIEYVTGELKSEIIDSDERVIVL